MLAAARAKDRSMNCFVHERTAAIGLCAACQAAICRQCVGRDTPRLICSTCAAQPSVLGYEYKSAAAIGSWPLIHICMGVDAVTMRPKVARGIIAIGNLAVGVVALGGLACGLLSLGGLSVGIVAALGGAALGLGCSIGGVAVGSMAVGGVAIGFSYAIGGLALGPAVINGQHCDTAAREFVLRWLSASSLPPSCR
jgi:hypothetical protein